MAYFTLGATVRTYHDGRPIAGFLTRLDDVVSRPIEQIEDILGYRRGRLSHGFYLLLLKEQLGPGDFDFGGTTMRSGGKLGLPSNDAVEEGGRRTISAEMIASYGQAGYDELRRLNTKTYPLTGSGRLVKVVPVADHDRAMGAADQYPPSSYAALQIIVKNSIPPKAFLVAAKVNADVWDLADGAVIRADDRPDYTRPVQQLPRRRIRDLLGNA